MFWKHPITKKNRFLSVVYATNGIPSYFDHDPSKTSTANSPSLGSTELAAPFPFSHRSSDQDYLEICIAPNDADGLVTSCRYLRGNSWYSSKTQIGQHVIKIAITLSKI